MVAEAFPELVHDVAFLKQILIRIDASAEDTDLEYDTNARLKHIARLMLCVTRMDEILATNREQEKSSGEGDPQQYITSSLLAALAVYQLIAYVQTGDHEGAETCLHSILCDFRWEFSPQLGSKRKRASSLTHLPPSNNM